MAGPVPAIRIFVRAMKQIGDRRATSGDDAEYVATAQHQLRLIHLRSSNNPRETPMLTLHHLNDSRSQRILWLLEELGTPFEMKRYQRDAQTRLAPPELKAVHPLGKSPVITDGDVRIAEPSE